MRLCCRWVAYAWNRFEAHVAPVELVRPDGIKDAVLRGGEDGCLIQAPEYQCVDS